MNASRPATWRLNVLVVDDSAVVRQAMTAVLSTDPDLEVTVAANPVIAMAKMKKTRPDVILLDLEMPRMDGLTFLRKIMAEDPLPVVICSSFAGRGTQTALRAMDEGAVAVVPKPSLGVKEFLHESALMMIDTVRGAAQARVRPRGLPSPARPRLSADAVLPAAPAPAPAAAAAGAAEKVVAIGASTGGTEALRALLVAMPREAPAILIVQHMPEVFTRAFAERLDQICAIEVKEAADGDRVAPGRALIAPGNRHTLLARRGTHHEAEVRDGPLVSRHRPSVDVLFRSVAQTVGPGAVGVILTGMGDDGAEGLLEMKRAGAATVAQDEATCVVFGMPREAIARRAVDEVLALPEIPSAILRLARERAREA